jgi:hypothetical protein
MLEREVTNQPFFEEEITEAILPSLGWRAESRVRRPVLARGGIVADEVSQIMLVYAECILVPFLSLMYLFQVGYGKTAITLGLIDSVVTAPPVPKEYCDGYIESSATLVVVPAHLMGQVSWHTSFCLMNEASPRSHIMRIFLFNSAVAGRSQKISWDLKEGSFNQGYERIEQANGQTYQRS